MIKKKIEVPFDRIDVCFHVADIHIRNLKRHKEYKEVFNNLYKKIKAETNSNENSIIYVAGDIAHAKTDMSPELVSMISNFLQSLANIAPTILIAGNHDCNLNNPNRLDVLEPIVEALQNPNLHYLKDSGIYTIADVDFVVFSVFDTPDQYISADMVPGGRTKVALYHGPVNGILLDSGMILNTDKVTLKHFEGYDMGMLGDIHKWQYLNKEKTIGYSSSLLQQNHGEDYKNHGMIKWDILKRKPTFIPIENNYGFYTLYIKDNNLPDISDLPKHPRLRVRIQNTLMSNVKQIIADIKKKYNVKDIVINVVDVDKVSNLQSDSSDSIIGDINDITHQNRLITEYLDSHFHAVDDKMLEKVVEINNKLNLNLKQADNNTIGVQRKLKTLEFSNLFSYGENNFIDFTSLEGIQGLFAPNSHGKCVDPSTEIEIKFDKEYIIKKLGFLPDELKE